VMLDVEDVHRTCGSWLASDGGRSVGIDVG